MALDENTQLEIVRDPNEVTGSGLTQFQKRTIARESGFEGEFGSGDHRAFLNSSPENRALFESNISSEVARQNRVFGSTEGFREAQGQISTLQAARAGLSLVKLAGSSGFKGITAAIDAVAADAFPSIFGKGATAAVQGAPIGNIPYLPKGTTPFSPATSASPTSFSSIVGGAGTGFTIGSLIGSFTGLKQTGSQVGGTVGGIVGSIFPVVGTIVGSIIGSVIGGFFGGGPPVQASQFATRFNKKGQLDNLELGSKTIGTEQGRSVGLAYGQFLENLNIGLGGDFEDLSTRGGFNDKYEGGFFIGVGRFEAGDKGASVKFDAQDTASTETAFFEITDQLLRRNPDANVSVVARVDELKAEGKTTQEAISAIYEQNLATQAAADAASDVLAETPEERIADSVTVSTNQIDSYIAKVAERKAGKSETIKTSPRGLLDDTPVLKKQLGGVIL